MRRALIASLSPRTGGVSAMQRATLRFLAERGFEATLAWYEPYSWTPRLSVPAFRIGTRRVDQESRPVVGAREGLAIGAWLPELEFTHYWPTGRWRELIARHDLHLAVAGNCLPGLALARTRTPFLAWVASDWHGDRKDRVVRFPPLRRWLDRLVVRPAMRRLEPEILRRGHVLALSAPTRTALDRVAGAPVSRAVLPFPIELERFDAEPSAVVPGRVGLVGRFSDPRKNVSLFLAAVAEARRSAPDLEAVLIGSSPSAEIEASIERAGLVGCVSILGHLDRAQYVGELKRLDLLVVSSHQEGLGIAALEALACGCPVVSTRCGGPEEFVRDGENGYLTAPDAGRIARLVVGIAGDRALRERLGRSARATVEADYSWPRFREIFDRELAAFERHSAASGPGFEA